MNKAGPRPAFRNALVGGLILGFIEMAQIVMIKWQRKSDLDNYNQMIQGEVSKEKQRRQKEMDKYREGKKYNHYFQRLNVKLDIEGKRDLKENQSLSNSKIIKCIEIIPSISL